ncbi:aminotransferase class I/II-fold pyridoxal phosphate-dependent enzyme [Brucepastera parasyntrophica]|uniref:aminotransferase class I/II-fold pyridoxal phosphate-dependent enzyme n=1 Tax=Brucepastera parasyntrophica TaxID=2880008 RepID=UPI00210A9905|nr:aminotransferase class I/II-fold pyridoxal phosphate-dependent enzyme [Brucepastera parasyntrophica]ULQ60706.1 aminotransferase class I/II-fold pyridoxal phosphate-dependent enzyme [Brucepastera parasyntrophica]
MSNSQHIHPLAQELNTILAPCIAGRLLSELGSRLYFPKGIIAQSAEAKKYGKTANATIGMAVNHGQPLILSALQDQLPSLSPGEAVGYAPTAGNPELCQVWLDSIYEKNPSLKGSQITMPILVPGLTAGLFYLADMFLDDDSVLLTGAPAWDNYVLIAETRRNATLKGFSMFKDGKFDISGFGEAVREQAKTGTVRMLLNFPQNPSGYTPTKTEAAEIVKIITETAEDGADVLVWCDDAYFDLDYENDIEPQSLFAYLANAHERVLAVKIDGPTKEDYVWGLRTGFLTFGSKGMNKEQYDALIKKFTGAIRCSVSCTATPSQSLLLKTISDSRTEQEKKAFKELLKERYQVVRKFIDSHKDSTVLEALPFNSGYFMSIKCKGIAAEELRQKLLHEHGIGTVSIDERHLRVAFSSVDTEKIEMVYNTIFSTAEELRKK